MEVKKDIGQGRGETSAHWRSLDLEKKLRIVNKEVVFGAIIKDFRHIVALQALESRVLIWVEMVENYIACLCNRYVRKEGGDVEAGHIIF